MCCVTCKLCVQSCELDFDSVAWSVYCIVYVVLCACCVRPHQRDVFNGVADAIVSVPDVGLQIHNHCVQQGVLGTNREAQIPNW